jgi:hypothetical protein
VLPQAEQVRIVLSRYDLQRLSRFDSELFGYPVRPPLQRRL